MFWNQVRRKVFISYHHSDQREVENFISTFGYGPLGFIHRALGLGMSQDIVDSTNTEYVMRRIRELYLKDSTVTIVLVGRRTWSRRYVDWEIQASLRGVQGGLPNGLLGIVLPSVGLSPVAPDRLRMNVSLPLGLTGYARWYWCPQTHADLKNMIEEAFRARTTRSHLIVNPRDRFSHNRYCL
jgi:hypothetical protein